MSRKFALLIGIEHYDNPHLPQLQVPAHDVRALAEVLNAPEIGGFDSVDIRIDEPVESVRRAIDDLFAEKQPDDLLLLYFSGHGILNIQGDLFLTASDTRKDRLRSTAIQSSFIHDAMNESRSGRQVLILDCCYSGAFARGAKATLAATVIHEETFETIGGYGRFVLTATNATQYAWEGNQPIGELTNSVFTTFLIEGLRDGLADLDNDGNISVAEWYQYAFDQVISQNGNQSPHKWVYGQEGDEIIIAKSRSTDLFGVQQANYAHLQWEGRSEYRRVLRATPNLQLIDTKFLEENNNIQRNLLIEGDNLVVLKSLQETLAGKIKCIYIDPPFNSPNLMDDPLHHNLKSSANNFTTINIWLSFIYPRLILLRELLSDDGAIFVSIDDFGLPYLRLIMDEIFGSINHEATFIWRRNISSLMDSSSRISLDHEYILCYAHSSNFRLLGQPVDESRYTNPDNDPRGRWISVSLLSTSTKSGVSKLSYPLIHPSTGQIYYPSESRSWRYARSKMEELISKNQILWPRTSTGQPRLKRFLSELSYQYRPISTFIEAPPAIEGSRELSKFIDHKEYVHAKPSALVKTFISQIPGNDFIVLDCFAGSGVTGQAVFELNEEDGGSRSFILIEKDHNILEEITKRRIEAYLNTKMILPQTVLSCYTIEE